MNMPKSNLCEPVLPESHVSKEFLNFAITIYAPVSSVPGSPVFFFLQPLLYERIFASVGILIAAQLFLFLANRIFGLESIPFQKGQVISPEQTVRMSLSDLLNSLTSVSRSNIKPLSDQAATLFPSETPEIPLAFGIAVYGDFTDKPFSPAVFVLLPLFTFSGVRGALPLLILETLSTIFVRSVVPPETTGSKPLKELGSK
jgi:hypothetical protein